MELGQKTARCESLRALLPYVVWDRFVTLAGSKSGLRVTLPYLYLDVHAQYTFSIISEIYVLFNYSELGIILNFIVLYDSVYISDTDLADISVIFPYSLGFLSNG